MRDRTSHLRATLGQGLRLAGASGITILATILPGPATADGETAAPVTLTVYSDYV